MRAYGGWAQAVRPREGPRKTVGPENSLLHVCATDLRRGWFHTWARRPAETCVPMAAGPRQSAQGRDRERRLVRKIVCCTYVQLTCGGGGSILGHVGPPKHACLWRLGPGSPPKGGTEKDGWSGK